MISKNSLEKISHIFCGDVEDLYVYKKGPQLVTFFNQYYNSDEKYGVDFPSRWIYVYDKLVQFVKENRLAVFFNIILSKEYLISERLMSQVEAAEKSEIIRKRFNDIVQQDMIIILKKDGKYNIIEQNEDLELVGNGGFANVYYQKSSGKIIKKLKDDFLTERSVRSRFKREYKITNSLQDMNGVIKVFSFDEGTCSYSMERAETTLEKFILNNTLSESAKINSIRQILYVMKEVHNRDIIHRDISANNIFIISGVIKIADFGLGKDLKVFTSHQTLHTNAIGQFYYCAPEQFMMLKDADKRSDVYSLGRVINFIMTEDPTNSHHIFRSVAEKASNSEASYRYANAGQMLNFFEKAVEYNLQAENKQRIEEKIKNIIFDDEIENYLYNLPADDIARMLHITNLPFSKVLLKFMDIDDQHAQYIIQSIDKSYQSICGRSFEAYDVYASFAYDVLQGDYEFVVKEIASNVLSYVAWDINRFSAQHMVEELISGGIEPMLEDIIRD